MKIKGKSVVALVPLVYALAAVLLPWVDKGRAPGAVEWVQIGIGVTTALSVYLAPLVPEVPWIKSALGALLAGLGILTTAVLGGVSSAEWLDIAVYVAAALGITLAPAVSVTGTGVRAGLSDRPYTGGSLIR